jgi:molybdate transport system permease protein
VSAHLPRGLVLAAGSVLIVLLVLPVLVLVAQALRPHFFTSLFSTTVTQALRLSLITTGISLFITVILGTPVAYLLVHHRFPGRRFLDALLDVPLVLPPVVAGVGLLLVFGRRGFIGRPLDELGITLAFTSVSVVLAQIFVASPLFIRAMKAGFSLKPPQLEAAAVTLHASRWRTFWRVTLPLSAPSFVEGCILTWTRALGEFGATIVVAGSLAGRTRTTPLAIYAALERDLDAALALSALLAIAAFTLLLLVRRLIEPRAA